MNLPRRISIVMMSLVWAAPVAAASAPIPPAPPDIAGLTLPTGTLVPFAGHSGGLAFEDVSRSSFSKSGGTVVRYEVNQPPIPTTYGAAVQMVGRSRVICADQTVQEAGLVAYDRDGKVVMWLPEETAQPARGRGMAEALVILVCQGAHPPSPPLNGHQEAFAYATRALASGAGPKD